MRLRFDLRLFGKSILALSLLSLLGCGQADDSASDFPGSFQGVTLSVAALAEPSILESVRIQSGDWEREHDATIEFRSEPLTIEQAGSSEILIFSGDQLGALIDSGALATLDESIVRQTNALPIGQEVPLGTPEVWDRPPLARLDSLDFGDVLPAYREQVSRYGEDRIGLPLGGTALVLAYRRDAMESDANREAAEAAGLTLEPPETWEELDALARFFKGRDWSGDGTSASGIALALGDDSEGVGDAIFLSRAASLGQAPDRYEFLFDSETMAPRIASPPFIEALESLVALQAAGPEGMETLSAEQAREAFRSGATVFLIDRAEKAALWNDPEQPFPVAVAPLPGESRYFDPNRQDWRPSSRPNQPSYLPQGGGWLVGISSQLDDAKRPAAISYIQSLAGPELAQAIVSDPLFPMVPVRASHLNLGLPDPRLAPSVETRSWGQAVLQTFKAPQVVVGLRIPEAEGYLADLARARVAAIGGQTAREALDEVAQAWEERTSRLGVDRQRWHYRRSLNRLSTTPTPPPRNSK